MFFVLGLVLFFVEVGLGDEVVLFLFLGYVYYVDIVGV